ncbi:hypothetical protein B0T18DRAFT_400811 [Schizothecium vesticola]|uniref:Uncharacterized protein n=1 Tax=Schizothecium vesticola TaxID=314040 RepID=A0AA40F425_9PEZI|nr:hypothetical protein B0T18DRAFT_400811 [Schizothecium vesticola]
MNALTEPRYLPDVAHLLCVMSSTITTTAESTFQHGLQTAFSNYEIHHSGAPPADEAARDLRAHDEPSTSTHPLPVAWDVPHRRVPPFRATNRERDQGEVRVYTGGAERVFIGIMFTGVFVNATMAKAWHATFGRANDRIFRYPIGGEF